MRQAEMLDARRPRAAGDAWPSTRRRGAPACCASRRTPTTIATSRIPTWCRSLLSEAQIERGARRAARARRAQCARFQREHGLSEYDAQLLTESRALADFFEAAAARARRRPKAVANWILRDVLRALADRELEIEATRAHARDAGRAVHAGRPRHHHGAERARAAAGAGPRGRRSRGAGARARSRDGVRRGRARSGRGRRDRRARRERRALSKRRGEGAELPDRPGDAAHRRQGEPATVRELLAASSAESRREVAAGRRPGAGGARGARPRRGRAGCCPRSSASDAVRARIESAARAALGRALRYERLESGCCRRRCAVVAPARSRAPRRRRRRSPRRAASRCGSRCCRCSRASSRSTALVVERRDAAPAHGTRERLRAAAPRKPPKAARSEPEQASPRSAPRRRAASRGCGQRRVSRSRELRLRDATLVLEDAAVQPPVTWELRELDAKRAATLGARAAATSRLRSRSPAAGAPSVEGSRDARRASSISSSSSTRSRWRPLPPYLGDGTQLAGIVSGELELTGPAREPGSDRARGSRSRDADVRLGEICAARPAARRGRAGRRTRCAAAAASTSTPRRPSWSTAALPQAGRHPGDGQRTHRARAGRRCSASTISS